MKGIGTFTNPDLIVLVRGIELVFNVGGAVNARRLVLPPLGALHGNIQQFYNMSGLTMQAIEGQSAGSRCLFWEAGGYVGIYVAAGTELKLSAL